MLKPLSDKAGPGASAFNAAMLVGGPQAGAVVAPLFTAKSESVKLMAIESAMHADYGEAALSQLVKALGDKSGAVRKAAIAALGVNAQWGSKVSQEALAEVITGGKRYETEDRGMAIEAIAKAVALQNIRQTDVGLYVALVKALDDDQASVRAAAFAVLQPYQASDYKPDADKAARKAMIATWQTWAEGIVAKEPVAKAPAR